MGSGRRGGGHRGGEEGHTHAHLLIESITELGYATLDLVELAALLLPIPLDDVHGHFRCLFYYVVEGRERGEGRAGGEGLCVREKL
jgi:hypothetical protein